MQSRKEEERKALRLAEQKLRAKIEPLLLLPFYLVALAWIAKALGRW